MKIPKLEKNECSVVIADFKTGKIFKSDLTIFIEGENENEVFQIFKTFEKAKKWVIEFINEKPEYECSIWDNMGEHLLTYDLNGKR